MATESDRLFEIGQKVRLRVGVEGGDVQCFAAGNIVEVEGVRSLAVTPPPGQAPPPITTRMVGYKVKAEVDELEPETDEEHPFNKAITYRIHHSFLSITQGGQASLDLYKAHTYLYLITDYTCTHRGKQIILHAGTLVKHASDRPLTEKGGTVRSIREAYYKIRVQKMVTTKKHVIAPYVLLHQELESCTLL